MGSAKLPLVGAIIAPLRTGTPPQGITILGGPTDKSALKGSQAIFEVHLWMIPKSPAVSGTGTEWALTAAYDGDIASVRAIAAGNIPDGNNYPVKILDGYPIRGNVTLYLAVKITGEVLVDKYPYGPQVYGYAYRIGQGSVVEPERRFIGTASPDGISVGVPLGVPAATKTLLHKFESGHIDELSLGFMNYNSGVVANVDLLFEDASGNPVITGHKVSFQIPLPAASEPNYLRDPQSMYWINKAVFGNVIYPTLDHISIQSDWPLGVYGYFTRH